MEAHLLRCALLVAAVASMGASYRTPNFVVDAPTPALAEQIGQAAERYRRDLAIEWLGREMRNWRQPCPITAQVADHLGAGGATSFYFERGDVSGWRMTIQGSQTRILDSVLPHEVTHTIFATHFRQPLPRWADEGACTTVEHQTERTKQQQMLITFLRTGRGIAFNRMFAMKDYPHDVMPLYSQGYSVARYLVAQGGKQKFLNFLADGLRDENWSRAVQKHYGADSLATLQNNWLAWVREGSPKLDGQGAPALVAVSAPSKGDRKPRPEANLIHYEQEEGDQSAAESAGENSGPSVYELASAPRGAKPGKRPARDAWRAADATAGEDAPADDVAKHSASSAKAPQPTEVADDDSRPAATHQATRPQEIQRSRQVILEWSRPPAGTEGATPATAAASIGPVDDAE